MVQTLRWKTDQKLLLSFIKPCVFLNCLTLCMYYFGKQCSLFKNKNLRHWPCLISCAGYLLSAHVCFSQFLMTPPLLGSPAWPVSTDPQASGDVEGREESEVWPFLLLVRQVHQKSCCTPKCHVSSPGGLLDSISLSFSLRITSSSPHSLRPGDFNSSPRALQHLLKFLYLRHYSPYEIFLKLHPFGCAIYFLLGSWLIHQPNDHSQKKRNTDLKGKGITLGNNKWITMGLLN